MAVYNPRFDPTSMGASTGSSPKVQSLKDILAAQPVQKRESSLGKSASTKGAPDEGGWRGLVGDVLGSAPAKILLKPLTVLDVPRRVVISGIKEGIDIFGPDDASLGDFVKQVKDPNFGAGQFVNTGSKWADRILGFVGDVALDPLTYATFGASHFAGSGGRLALANLAKDAGMSGAKLGEIARYGRAALNADEIARLGINRSGVYMFGKRLTARRIPLTGRIGELSEKGLASLRLAGSETKLGSAMQKAFTPKDYKELRIALAKGDIPDSKVGDVITTIVSRDTERQAAARGANEGQRRVAQTMAEAGEAEIQSTRKTLHKYMENPALLANASPVEQKALSRWTTLFSSFWDDVDAIIKLVDPSGGFGRFQNYFPHMSTDAANKWMRESRGAYSKEVAELIDRPLDPASVFQHRKLKEGMEWFGTKLGKDDLTVDRLNEIARNGGFTDDFFETDIITVAEKYVGSYSKQMGISSRLKELSDKGVLKTLSDRAIDETIIDTGAKAAHEVVLKAATKDLVDVGVNFKSALQMAAEGVVVAKNEAVAGIANVTEAAVKATTAADAAALQLTNVNKKMDDAVSLLDNYQRTIEGLLAPDGSYPISAGPVFKQLDELKIQLVQFKDEFAGASANEARFAEELAAAKAEGAAAEAVVKKRQAAERATTKRATDAKAKKVATKIEKTITDVQDTVNYNQLLTENYNTIVQGTDFTGANSELLNNIGKWIGAQELPQAARTKGVVPSKFSGGIDKYIKSSIGGRDWFKRLTGKLSISPTEVAKGSYKGSENTVVALLDNGARNIEDGRKAGLWMLARDEKFFGENVPEVLVRAREDLVRSLEDAESSVVASTARENVVEVAAKTGLEGRSTIRMNPRTGVTNKVVAKKIERAADKLLGGDIKSASAGAARGTDLNIVAEEAKQYADNLSKYSDVRKRLEAAGLSNSSEPLTEEAKQMLINIITDQKATAQRNAADSADNLVGDVADGNTADLYATEGVDNSLAGEVAEAEDYGSTVADATDSSVYSKSDYIEGGSVENIITVTRNTRLDSDFEKAFVIASSQPMETFGDLYNFVKTIEDTVGQRQWIVGKGSTREYYTVNDAIVGPLSKDGRSKLDIAVANRAAKDEVKAAQVTRLTPEESSQIVAEKLTQYIVLSELHQRFVNVSALLGKHGQAVTKDMLSDTAKNVTRNLRQHWQAKVEHLTAMASPDLERAQGVLKQLDALTLEPSDELFSMMLGDVSVRVRSSAANASDATRVSGLSTAARGKMDDATDSLQRMKSTPQYVKAMHDKDMVDAMDDLAASNLDQYVLPDGTKGFPTKDAEGNMDVLMMPDGVTPVSFTEAEWRSLYKDPKANVVVDTTKVTALEEDIAKLANNIQNGKTTLTNMEKARAAGKLTEADLVTQQKIFNALGAAQQKLDGLQIDLAKLKSVTDVHSPAVQQMALEKMRVLVHGNGKQQGWYNSGVDLKGVLNSDNSAVALRRTNIKSAWESGPQAKFLAEVDNTAAKAEVYAQKSFSNSVVAINDHADVLTKAADDAAKLAQEKAAKEAADAAAEAPEVIPDVIPSAPVDNTKVSTLTAMLKEASTGSSAARASLKKVETKISKLEATLASVRQREATRLAGKAEKQQTVVNKLADTLHQAQGAFDAAEAVRASAQEVAERTIPWLEDTIAFVDSVIDGTVKLPQTRTGGKFGPRPVATPMPQTVADRAAQTAADRALTGKNAAARLRKAGLTNDEANELTRWRKTTQLAMKAFNDDPNDPIARVLMAAAHAEGKYFMADLTVRQNQLIMRTIDQGDIATTFKKATEDGFASLEKIGLKGTQAPKEIAEVLQNVRRADQPAWAKELNRFFGKYTRFFKAYATLSIGFHVRNAMSNTFSLVAAGADIKNIHRGFDLYRDLISHINNKGKIDDWLLKFSGEEGKRIEIAVRAMESAGGGRVEEAFAGFARQGSTITDNILTRGSLKLGERVEGSGRFMLAYDSAAKGLDFNTATARVKRYLFDYTDVGSFDENIRQIVPFWMWMSRNLPLQLVNQWSNPRAYAMYNNLMRNVGQDDSKDVVPSWLKEQGSVKIADGWYLAPDLGFNRLSKDLEQLKDPARLLSYVNPALRLPVEVFGGRKFYNNVPFSQDKEKVAAGFGASQVVAALADLLGQTERGPNGQQLVDPKLNYVLQSLLPMLGKSERLVPESDEMKPKVLGNWASFLGVPVRQVTQGMRDNELRRQSNGG
jgi:hypothetical protein